MITHAPRVDTNETSTGSRIFDFLRKIDANRRWRLWIDALEFASDGVTEPADLRGLLLASLALQRERAMLTDNRELTLELLATGETILKNRPAALAFCSAVLAQVAARAADADDPRPREAS